MIVELWLAYRNKPKPVIEVSNERKGKLGFSVYVRKKEVENATVKCNNIRYNWETEDGTVAKSVDLMIGDSPVSFFPFDVKSSFAEYPSPTDFLGEIRLQVQETATQKVVYDFSVAIPRKARWLVTYSPWDIRMAFLTRIRIIGKGIEEESDYILRIGLNNLIVHPIREGKPLMEYVEWGFEIKKTSKFFYRKRKEQTLYT